VKESYDTDLPEVLGPLRRKIFALCGRLHSPTKRPFKEKKRYLLLYCVVTIIGGVKGVE
jgi:hypothetical protein